VIDTTAKSYVTFANSLYITTVFREGAEKEAYWAMAREAF
jgi:hypothetical protein